VVVSKWQQCEEPSTFDRAIKLSLIDCLRTRQTGGNNFAVFLNKIAQGVYVLVIDFINASRAKTAELTAFEQRILLCNFFFSLRLPKKAMMCLVQICLISCACNLSFGESFRIGAKKPCIAKFIPNCNLPAI